MRQLSSANFLPSQSIFQEALSPVKLSTHRNLHDGGFASDWTCATLGFMHLHDGAIHDLCFDISAAISEPKCINVALRSISRTGQSSIVHTKETMIMHATTVKNTFAITSSRKSPWWNYHTQEKLTGWTYAKRSIHCIYLTPITKIAYNAH